jgi:hypothetical protein
MATRSSYCDLTRLSSHASIFMSRHAASRHHILQRHGARWIDMMPGELKLRPSGKVAAPERD